MNQFLSSGQIVSKPVNPLTDNYKTKLNAQASVRAGLDEYDTQTSTASRLSSSSETTHL